MTDSFTSGDMVKLTGIPYRTLDHWARTGLIMPSIASANGTGSERRYSFRDLILVHVALCLRGQISVGTLRPVLRFLAAQPELKGGWISWHGEDVRLFSSEDEIDDEMMRSIMASGPHLMVYLSPLIRALEQKAEGAGA